MKRIIKKPDPLVIQELLSFIQLEKQASIIPIYENFRKRNELRQSLLKEQGYICCFCMKSIEDNNETTKIAHIFPQNPVSDEDKEKVKKENLDLDYNNMLAACDGGKGQSPHLQHCDTKQGNTILKINPADAIRDCEKLIDYKPSGTIYSKNPDVEYDLNQTLNLNEENLKNRRKDAYDAVLKSLERKYPNKSFSKRSIENEIQNYSQPKNGRYAPYCQYVIYFLRKKLAKLS
jgi:uncharacterized protein (TIGR02646 family)